MGALITFPHEVAVLRLDTCKMQEPLEKAGLKSLPSG